MNTYLAKLILPAQQLELEGTYEYFCKFEI